MPRERIHLTLAFLGALTSARAQEARLAAQAVRSNAFEMALDQIGSFRAARVAWAGCAHPPAGLTALEERLAVCLRACDFALEERPFAAHVTLARKISAPLVRSEMEPLSWRAREFTLVRSEPGSGRYVVLETWPLKGS